MYPGLLLTTGKAVFCKTAPLLMWSLIRPAATFHSSDATVVIGRRLSYPCPSRALFYNYAPLLPASSYFNSYLHRHVLLYHHVVIMEGILYEYIIVTFFPRAYFGANMVLLAGSSAPKSCPWENLALQYSILVRNFWLQHYFESNFFGTPCIYLSVSMSR